MAQVGMIPKMIAMSDFFRFFFFVFFFLAVGFDFTFGVASTAFVAEEEEEAFPDDDCANSLALSSTFLALPPPRMMALDQPGFVGMHKTPRANGRCSFVSTAKVSSEVSSLAASLADFEVSFCFAFPFNKCRFFSLCVPHRTSASSLVS